MANDQQFCLRWNNHQSTLISVFDSLLENGTLVDCTLAAEGQYLKAHKVVLSACSPYLETLLSQHYEKHPIVILKDVKFSELKSMMDYMYRGEVNISQDQLGTFLKAAESLQIKGLSDNGDDARDVGSTAKKSDAPRPSVTQTRAPIESKRPAPIGDMSDTSRDGSISPSSLRKRRRTRRPSQGDDPDSNLDNNVCDLPAAQSTPMPVPSAAPVQSLPKQIVKTEPPPPMPEPVKKEILDPPAEPLLEPKTEYLDYMNNENSIEVEDLTLDDDDEEGLDSSMDASRPGPSHGDLSQQGGYPPWTMTGDQSGTDEIFMAAQEAVGAATGQQQRDSQGIDSEIQMIISSVTSLQGEPDVQPQPVLFPEESLDSNSESMPTLLPEETASLNSRSSNIFEEREASIPESLEDVTLGQIASEFESVYVPSPLGQYENEGTRESPICREECTSKENPSGATCIDICQGNYFANGPALKLVSVDRIITGQKKSGRPKVFRPYTSNEYMNNLKMLIKSKNSKCFGKGKTVMKRQRGRPRGRPQSTLKTIRSSNPAEAQEDQLKGFMENSVIQNKPKDENASSVLKRKPGRPFKNRVLSENEVKTSSEEGKDRKRSLRLKTRPEILVIPDQRPPSCRKKHLTYKKKPKNESHTSIIMESKTSDQMELSNTADDEIIIDPSVSISKSEHKMEVLKKKIKGRKNNTIGKKVFKCEDCDRTYCYLRGLRQHKKLECNVPPQFPCPFCPRQFRYRQGIREHVRESHPLAFPKWYTLHFIQPALRKYSESQSNTGIEEANTSSTEASSEINRI